MQRALLLGLSGFGALVLAAATAALPDVKATVVYRGARIHTAAGGPITKGDLVVQDGKVLAVGPEESFPLPADARIVNLAGKVIIPGLVDTHSHIGIFGKLGGPGTSDGNEGSGPVQSALRALDAIHPDDPAFRMALSGGVTTANIMPGSGNAIGGQTIYVKLRGATIDAMKIEGQGILGGLKMANGENPKRFNFDKKMPPATRMKLAALQREEFVKAREYRRKWDAYRKAKADGKEASQPDTDLALEPLVEVLEHKRTVHFHSHRADDLMTALRLAKEFDFEIVLQHATEGYRIADELAARKVPVSLTLVDSPGGKAEVMGLLEENAAILDKAGVKVAINTDDAITESRFFLRTGAIAVRGGMPAERALRALTIHGAEMLHLDHRLGSLEKGKDADFVVLSGPPFSVYTRVLQTYIEGELVFDSARPLDRSYQHGGFALAERSVAHDALPPAPAAVKPPSAVSVPGPDARYRPLRESAERFAVFAGRVYPVSGEPIDDGVVVVEKGKITAVGKRGQVVVPPGTPVLETAVVTPGLIDADTVVGLSGALNAPADQDQDELSGPNQADVRVLDGFNPAEPLLEYLVRQGVTVVHAAPGRSNVIAGQTGIFRTAGNTAEQMTVRFPAGLLVNLGEIPKRSYPGKLPTTRMGTASLVRTAFVQAQNYARKRAGAEDKRPATDAKLEALSLALERKLPVLFAAHRADDLSTALRLGKEFNLDVRLELATEGYLVAGQLADNKVPVVVHPAMQRPGSLETYHSYLGNAAVLADHKVPLALGTGFEGYVPKTRVLRHEAAIAMVHGLGTQRALSAITLDAARILGIADRYGSLEPGKAADLVLYDGDPFEHATHVTHTFLDGRLVWNRDEYLKLPYARRVLPMIGGASVGGCCLDW
jgi:imidazolonepropionase-like amidohydrolase